MARRHSNDFLVSTSEIADIINPKIDKGRETVEGLAERSGVLPRAILRIRKRETGGTTSRVAEALLEAAGAHISELPSYHVDNWNSRGPKEAQNDQG